MWPQSKLKYTFFLNKSGPHLRLYNPLKSPSCINIYSRHFMEELSYHHFVKKAQKETKT